MPDLTVELSNRLPVFPSSTAISLGNTASSGTLLPPAAAAVREQGFNSHLQRASRPIDRRNDASSDRLRNDDPNQSTSTNSTNSANGDTSGVHESTTTTSNESAATSLETTRDDNRHDDRGADREADTTSEYAGQLSGTAPSSQAQKPNDAPLDPDAESAGEATEGIENGAKQKVGNKKPAKHAANGKPADNSRPATTKPNVDGDKTSTAQATANADAIAKANVVTTEAAIDAKTPSALDSVEPEVVAALSGEAVLGDAASSDLTAETANPQTADAVVATAASTNAVDPHKTSLPQRSATEITAIGEQQALTVAESQETESGISRRTKNNKRADLSETVVADKSDKPSGATGKVTATESVDIRAIAATPALDESAGLTAQTISTLPGESADAKKESLDTRVAAVPAGLAAAGDKATAATRQQDNLSEVDRVRFVQRVAKAFQSVGDEGGEIRLRLSPPELGSLRLELTIKDGAMSAHLEAETTHARNLLLDNLPELRERLAEQNIKIERFDVDVREESSHGSGNHTPNQSEQNQDPQRNRPRGPATSTNRVGGIAPAGQQRTVNVAQGKLNVVI